MGKGIYIIQYYPSEDTLLCRHLADEETDLATDGLNAPVLLRAQKETFIRALDAPAIGMRSSFFCGIVLKKGAHQKGFPTSRRTCEKEVAGHFPLLKTRIPYGILTH
jgi:hypothetical protein